MYYAEISDHDLDGINQLEMINVGVASKRRELVYNINERTGRSAIRYYEIFY